MERVETEEAQRCLQALTFTLARKEQIPNNKQMINKVLISLGFGIRALERQVPKRLEKVNMTTVCPDCGRNIVRCYAYCPDCGQRIDWQN